MSAPCEPPELNYVALTGRVAEKGELRLTNLNIFHIRLEVENIISPSPDAPSDQPKNYIVDVEAWGTLAEEVDRSIRPGMYVLLEGVLVSRTYVDRMKREQHRMVVKAFEISALGTLREE